MGVLNIREKERERTFNYFINEILKDRNIPLSIKNKISESMKVMEREKQPIDIRISTVISILDSSSENPNLSFYARTSIWNIVSKLEELRKRRR